MIVISGALVVVALVLLVIGLVIAGLGWVYASIAVSLLSFVFLVIGILQRRKEAPAAETPATAAARSTGSSAEVGSEAVAVRTTPSTVASSTDADSDTTVTTLPTTAAPSGKVLVVAGRPRYHVEGCRYLTGKDAESVDVSDARAEGFTACGVCKPDAALAATADSGDAPDATTALEVPVSAEMPAAVVDEPTDEAPVRKAPARARTAAPAAKKVVPAKKAAPATKAAAARKAAPAKKATAPAAADNGAPVKKAAPAKRVTAAKAAPAKAPVKAAPAKAAAKTTAAKAPAKKAPAKKAPAKKA